MAADLIALLFFSIIAIQLIKNFYSFFILNLGLNLLIFLILFFSQTSAQRAALWEVSELVAELVDSLIVIGNDFMLIDVRIVEVVDIVGVETVDTSE